MIKPPLKKKFLFEDDICILSDEVKEGLQHRLQDHIESLEEKTTE